MWEAADPVGKPERGACGEGGEGWSGPGVGEPGERSTISLTILGLLREWQRRRRRGVSWKPFSPKLSKPRIYSSAVRLEAPKRSATLSVEWVWARRCSFRGNGRPPGLDVGHRRSRSASYSEEMPFSFLEAMPLKWNRRWRMRFSLLCGDPYTPSRKQPSAVSCQPSASTAELTAESLMADG